jgi:predicted alpha/beta-fold hydrolase
MAKQVTATLALKNPQLDEIDDSWTRFVGSNSPYFPFKTNREYYIYTSCHRALNDIRIPFLTINAGDDPIVRSVPVNAIGPGWGVMVITQGGGHLGWFEAGVKFGEATRWIKKPVLEWLRAVGEDLVLDNRKGLPLHEVGGFLKEIGRDDIGCKEVGEEAGFIVSTAGQEGIMRGL